MIAYKDDDEIFQTNGESKMMPILVDFLRRRNWIREDTLLARELPINGRRVDLAVYTRSKVSSAFELKIGGFSRVLEQAHYNRLSFHRSWIVVPNLPRQQNLAEARKFGIGVIVIEDDIVKTILHPARSSADRVSRLRVEDRFLEMGALHA